MYSLPYFKEKDIAIVKEFMQQNSFVTLCGVDANNKPVATQVPLLIIEKEGKFFFHGHVQRKTDHQLAFEQNNNVLAIFTGPHTYVSASWYDKKQTPSTWNYISVHAKGVLTFLDDNALLDILTKTTAHFENDPHSPSLVEKMPQEDVQKMMKAIIAFEIEVTHIDNVFKLSQNRDEKTYHNIINELEKQDDNSRKIAEEMKERENRLFKKD